VLFLAIGISNGGEFKANLRGARFRDLEEKKP
jgi:hypothetical protein